MRSSAPRGLMAVVVVVVVAAAASVVASPSPPRELLFLRQTNNNNNNNNNNGKCAAAGLASCAASTPGLSAAFCCEANSKCLPLAGNSTVICCPSESSCNAIRPITCSLGEQDPSTNLHAPIKTLALTSTLPKCAKNDVCCPFGYTCNDDGNLCTRNSDQSKAPAGYSSTTTTTTAIASTDLAAATSTAPAASSSSSSGGQDTDSPPSPPSSGGAAKTSIIGGTVGGVLALVVLSVLLFMCVKSRSGASSSSSPPSVKPKGSVISAPIMTHNPSIRREVFIKESPADAAAPPRIDHEPRYTTISLTNPFASSSSSPRLSAHSSSTRFEDDDDEDQLRPGQVVARPVPPIRGMTTKKRQSQRASTYDIQKEPSGDNVRHFEDLADPQTRELRPYSAASLDDSTDEAHVGNPRLQDARYGPRVAAKHVPGTTPNF